MAKETKEVKYRQEEPKFIRVLEIGVLLGTAALTFYKVRELFKD